MFSSSSTTAFFLNGFRPQRLWRTDIHSRHTTIRKPADLFICEVASPAPLDESLCLLQVVPLHHEITVKYITFFLRKFRAFQTT